MKEYSGRRGRWEWSSRPIRFTPGNNACTLLTGGWVGPTGGLDVYEKRKSLSVRIRTKNRIFDSLLAIDVPYEQCPTQKFAKPVFIVDPKHHWFFFYDWLTVHRSITLVNFQLDAQILYLFIHNTFIKILCMFLF
jgi:hypothetical protein